MENINIYKYSRLSQSEILNLCKRAESNLSGYFEIVDEIIKNVEENKENALVEYSKKLDKVKSGLQEFSHPRNPLSGLPSSGSCIRSFASISILAQDVQSI